MWIDHERCVHRHQQRVAVWCRPGDICSRDLKITAGLVFNDNRLAPKFGSRSRPHVRRDRLARRAGTGQSMLIVCLDRLAPSQRARKPAAWQRSRPDVEIFGGEVSSSPLRLAKLHSITSSASASRFGGTSRPSALAVLILIINSNFVGCRTGRSAGLAPLRIRPV